MPGVSRRDDMNGYQDFENGHLRTSSYLANGYDPYKSEFSEYDNHLLRASRYQEPPTGRSGLLGLTARSDYYPQTARSEYNAVSARSDHTLGLSMRERDVGYGRSGRHNGIDPDFDQNSLDDMRDGTEPTFEVDHLATYTTKSGTTNPEDGLLKLKQMENSTGIWTMRCMLVVERRHLIVIDKGNGDELERFPLYQIHEPTAVIKNDRREVYDNLLLFTVLDDPRRKNTPSDMHIFQSIDIPAHKIVDCILSACGRIGVGVGGRKGTFIPPPPSGPAPEPPYMGKLNDTHLHESRMEERRTFEQLDDAYNDSGADAVRLRETRSDPYRLGATGRLNETRIEETRQSRMGESSRFNDASRWINSSYQNSPAYKRSQSYSPSRSTDDAIRDVSPVRNLSAVRDVSPWRGSTRSLRTVEHDRIPDFLSDFPDTWNLDQRTLGDYGSKGGYSSGTWSGRNNNPIVSYNTTGGGGKSGKKGKKWYQFGMKRTVQKSKSSGKENKAYKPDYDSPSGTLPLSQSKTPSVQYASLSKRRIKSDTDFDTVDAPGRYGDAGRELRASYIHHADMDTGQNEALERDVQLLNNCFDDIEKFVARLQQAAEAYKELERRRHERGNKNKRRSQGDGMLNMRARPPPAQDFIDIFQKFKFAFNLLAKLKAHIHDPNAPELVHFLFTPLSLIYEASRDPTYKGEDLAGRVVAPLLLYETKQLLLNCLSSRELELWQHLGKPWTLIKEEWRGPVPQYNPRFYNGWQPSPQQVESAISPTITQTIVEERPNPIDPDLRMSRKDDPYSTNRDFREDPYRVERVDRGRDDRIDNQEGQSVRRDEIWHPPPQSHMNSGYAKKIPEPPRAQEPIRAQPTRAEENNRFMQELKRTHAIIYEAVHERRGKNSKELNIEKGDILQVLDKSRNWWKLKNFKGEMGYAPYTIMKECEYDSGAERRLSGDYSSYISGSRSFPPPAPAPPPVNGSSRGGRGDLASRQREPSPQRTRDTPSPRTQKSQNLSAGSNRSSVYSDELHNELRNKINGHSPRQDYRSQPEKKWSPQPVRGRPPSQNSLTPPPDRRLASSPRRQSPPPVHRKPPSPRHLSPPANRRGELVHRVMNITQHSSAKEVQNWLETKGFSQRCIMLLDGYTGLDLFDLQKSELERLLGREEGKHLDSLLNVQKSNSGYKTRSTAELRAILQKRKERADTHGSDEAHMGRPPNFTPDTPPDYSSEEEDESSDDFGDAGKTLRNLLERQRRKIQSGYYKQYNPQYN